MMLQHRLSGLALCFC